MSEPAPILLVAFNRPEKLRGLIDSLRPSRPPLVILAVDGPRRGVTSDEEKVKSCRRLVDAIDWGCSVETIFHPENLGLQRAVESAVTEVMERHGRAIIIEDDVVVGGELVSWLSEMLDTFADRPEIMHISGYNVVPEARLACPRNRSRLSRYPESFVWATWADRWESYDPASGLAWATSCRIGDLRRVVGSIPGALRWRQTFRDVEAGLLDTWAYRWISCIWANDGWVLSPNRNLATYAGYDEGTHTRTGPSWSELPVVPLPEVVGTEPPTHDRDSDLWVGRTVFGESLLGVVRGLVISVALCFVKHRRVRSAGFVQS